MSAPGVPASNDPPGTGTEVAAAAREARLDGKVALVTGAGRGIGRAIALRLAQAGADLVVNDVDEGAADDAATTIGRTTGRQTLALGGDVTVTTQVDTMIARAVEHFGHLDVLVPNAGIIANAPLTATTDEAWQRVLEVNLGGTFRCARAAAPLLREGGAIVAISSGAAWGSNRGQSNYSAAKAGIIGLVKTLAIELAPAVRVNAVAPGAITSEMTRATAAQIGLTFEEYIADTSQRVALQRLGEPEDVADVVCFLASPMASYVTGQVLKVGGNP